MGDRPKQSTVAGNVFHSIFYSCGPLLYLTAVLALAGLLAPVFYWVGHDWFHAPFSRYVNRALMVSALLALIPYFWKHWRHLGLKWERHSHRDLWIGVLVSIASVVLVVGVQMALGTRAWTGKLSVGGAFGGLATAVIVSVLEEILFRGALQTALVMRIGPVAGCLIASFFFAIVHFVKVPRSFAPSPVTWSSGYESLGLALAPLGQVETYSSALFCLFIIGLILGVVFLRTKTLWLAIGLHAGWILAGLKWGGELTEAVGPGADLLSGDITIIVLILTGLGLTWWTRRRLHRMHLSGPAR